MTEDFTVSSPDFNDIDLEHEEHNIGQQAQRTMWGMLGLGLAIGLIGMNLVIANPLIQRIDQMQRDIAVLQRNLKKITDEGEGLAETNSLLSRLSAQQQHVDEARKSLQQIEELQESLISSTPQTEIALHGAERLIALQDNILDQRELTVPAQKALDISAEMQRQIIASRPQVESARASVDGTIDLHDRIIRELSDISPAKNAIQEFVGMKSLILEQIGDIQSTKSKIQGVAELFGLLNHSQSDLESAKSSLKNLVGLKEKLVQESDSLIGAVQTLELLGDFQEEFKQRITSLQQMQQDLMSIAMLETTIGRVANAMKPFLELGDLRRLSASEVREAAKSILDRRTKNLAENSGREPRPQHLLATPEVPETDISVPEPKDVLLK